MFEILAFGIAIVAIIFSRQALSKLRTSKRGSRSSRSALPPQRTIVVSAPSATEAPLAPTIAPEAPRGASPQPQTWIQTPAEPATPPPLPEKPAAQPKPPATPQPPSPGFEERLGTRWVVWVGGLTLALGGLFLVRYSIEAGLLGPAARVFFGGLFAAALLAAGEWTRRKEAISSIAPLPIANIPAILTAAGTAVAFGTVYAALRALRLPLARDGLRRARPRRARDACRGPAARTGACGPRRRRRVRDADARRRPTSRISGRSTSTSPSSPPRRSASRASACGAGSPSPPSCSACCGRWWRWARRACCRRTRSASSRGFALAATLVVSGFLFGPEAEPGKIEPISSVSLGVYLFAATLDGHLVSPHRSGDDRVRGPDCRDHPDRLAHRCRSRRAAGSGGVRRRWSSCRGRCAAIRNGWSRPAAPCRASAPKRSTGSVQMHLIAAFLFAAGFGISGFLAQGRSRACDGAGDLVGGCGRNAALAADRLLCPHRPSRPLDPLRDRRDRARRQRSAMRPNSCRSASRGRARRLPPRCSRPARWQRWRWPSPSRSTRAG